MELTRVLGWNSNREKISIGKQFLINSEMIFPTFPPQTAFRARQKSLLQMLEVESKQDREPVKRGKKTTTVTKLKVREEKKLVGETC